MAHWWWCIPGGNPLPGGGFLLVLAALALDWFLGDPPAWPHPVKIIGRIATWLEPRSRHLFGHSRLAGGACVLLVLLATGGATAGLMEIAAALHPAVFFVLVLYLAYSGIALRDLLLHGDRVREALEAGDLVTARQRVAMMVGRDTSKLDAAGVARAAVESLAENLVDGVTAPLFWLVVGGPVGLWLYKAASTMDSLFGYRNEKYKKFGTVAARLDDLANFLPARLTALVMVAAAFLVGLDGRSAWRILRRDRRRHASPNSGHPEAAMAGALGIQLGGPAIYHGRVHEKPWLGDPGPPAGGAHLRGARRLVIAATLLWVTLLHC